MNGKKRSFERKKGIAGFLFTLPWILGCLFFFLQPLCTTLIFSFREMKILQGGGYQLLKLDEGPFAHYIRAFTRDPDFLRYIAEAAQKLLYEVPIIVVFSLFIAIVLTQNFRGRLVMRAIFFLPVIVTSGVIISVIKSNLGVVALGGKPDAGNLFSGVMLYNLMLESGVPWQFAQYICAMISNIVDTVWRGGVQILIFMSVFLSIPQTYYQVAAVEGATGWESFWKITLPMAMPYIMVNAIYTIIDSFSTYTNNLMNYIMSVSYKEVSFSYGCALSWLYFITVMIFIGVVFFFISRRAHYDVN